MARIDGTQGNDTLVGTATADTLTGFDGDDLLEGLAGDDLLTGRSRVIGEGGNDTLLGGDGNDNLFASGTLVGGAGNDFLDVQTAGSQADGGDGDDFITASAPTVAVAPETVLAGGAGNDAFTVFSTWTSLTTVVGGEGWDTLRYLGFSTPADVHRVRFSQVEEISMEDAPANALLVLRDEFLAAGTTVKVVAREGLGIDASAETDARYWMVLAPSVHQALGGAGNDTLVAAFGRLEGGAGDDILVGAPDLIDYVPQPPPTGRGDIVIPGKLPVAGGDDQLFGGTGNDRLQGGMGDDRLEGGAGDDTIQGGDGRDAAVFSGRSTDYRLDFVQEPFLGLWVDEVEEGRVSDVPITGRTSLRVTDLRPGSPDGADLLHAVDVLVFTDGTLDVTLPGGHVAGSERNDRLWGGDGTQEIQSGDGDDTIYGLDGDDAIAAGEGNDRLSGGAGIDTLLGEGGNDTLVGAHFQQRSDEYMDGGAGDDHLYGQGVLIGGTGGDRLFLTGPASLVDAGDGNDLIDMAPAYMRGTTAIQLQQVLGGAGDDFVALQALPAGSAIGLLDGGAGEDTLEFAPGTNAQGYLSAIRNFEQVNFGGAVVLPDTFVAAGATARVTNFTFGASVDGSAETDGQLFLLGGSGRLTGGASADTVMGSGGVLDGGGGNDLVVLADAPAFGAAPAGTLNGGAGDDRLQVGVGSFAQLTGGAGADTVLDFGNTTAIYTGNGGDYGVVFVHSPITYVQKVEGTLADLQFLQGHATVLRVTDLRPGAPDGVDLLWNVDRLQFADFTFTVPETTGLALAGTASADRVDGTAGADALDGLAGADALRGLAGDDSLQGGDGNDSLEGGEGADMLLGGAGADQLTDRAGTNYLDGGDGDDSLHGTGMLVGGRGDDGLVSFTGAVSFADGGEGSDRLFFGVQAAPLTAAGGAGDDFYDVSASPSQGAMTLVGGSGFDTVLLNGSSAGWTVTLQDGTASVSNGATVHVVEGAERLRFTDAQWSLSGAGFDIDRDGAADLLWHNERTGNNLTWSQGDSALNRPLAQVPDTSWKIVGAADGNALGGADILWRHALTGEMGFWTRGEMTLSRQLPTLAPEWKVAGVADFDGSGQTDVFLRNTSTGENTLWRGETRALAAQASIDAPWQPAAVGDFDGNGKSDLLWRNLATGDNVLWLDGNSDRSLGVASLATDWKVAGTGDFNGDGRYDLLWRHAQTGENVLWGGAQAGQELAIADVDAAQWQVVGTGNYGAIGGEGRAEIVWRNVQTGQNLVWYAGNADLNLAFGSVTSTDWVLPAQTNTWLLPDGSFVA